ncbi:electron transfer flavoprotein-ubiquinone oxidoreductase [Pseudochelatococcus contaminans]|uniref:Electron transfer flavoprotein-ubiquinone oxidoreductase n=1 Tax=Pseudochelatococcus contaminans TaxID=1538103 RepID=A0A7W6EH00_9HYPH|nr:electron transfer flavoprotein-ubiquinone oxidoreductase [Pseudochelatococcus contaminans]MBB3809750.1 electron-transferring-flavoprotein dehydrogenase [Pseudochelatococcus contaminans]
MTDAGDSRESMDFDVVIVGAGPSGLAAAIRIRQLAEQNGSDISVVVVEKGSEVGAHILSGVVIDPQGLDALLPEWREAEDCPLTTQVTDDRFYLLSATGGIRLPNVFMPPLMNNHGNYIGSLGNVTRFLAARAEALGVEIYPGFAATEVLYGDDGEVLGIATGDMGIDRHGEHRGDYTRGMELRGKYTLFAEGARGSLTKQLVARFSLDKDRSPQKYGIGIKELWQVDPSRFHSGLVQHTFGWPLQSDTGGGSFLYHFEDNLVAVGFVLHLDYSNPTLSPFDEFQRFKTHPLIKDTFTGGKRLSYGARAITEGGWQSVPTLAFPGGALVGCAAGFVNVPRIKGSHNAIISGMLAAEAAVAALGAGRANDVLQDYEDGWRSSSIGKDLKPVRNVKPLWSRFGTFVGVALGGLDMWINTLTGLSPFGTLRHRKRDCDSLKRIDEVTPITYPKPDGVLTFDKLSSVFMSNTAHEEDQPPHLKLTDPSIPIERNLPLYGEPARLYCPAGVYEVVYGDEEARADPRFVINAQNCVHCKTCDIKDPSQNITWVPPEGGGGPNYPNM